MAQLPRGALNPEDVKPQDDMELIPAGWYAAMIVESDITPTKSGGGLVAKLTAELIQEGLKGRKIFININIENQNPKAVEIGRRELGALAHAVGLTQVIDTAELHGRPLQVRVKIIPADGRYEAKNEIKGYKPLTGAAPPPVQQQAAPAAYQQPVQQPVQQPAPAAQPAHQQPAAHTAAAPPTGSPPSWITQGQG